MDVQGRFVADWFPEVKRLKRAGELDEAGGEFEAAIISTFRPGISRSLGMNVVQRLERTIDVPVVHVVAE